jgi:hypothetical protein
VPAALSQIIVHLLEKEPDRRYQSAEGVVHDLEELAADPGRTLPIGEHDVPLRLLPASRLVGRDAETAELQAAFTEALSGRCPGVLVAGAPGVGKTALVNELRPVVADARGWFVAGKFDQYRRDLDFDAVNQALRALGRLLLAEPEAELAEICSPRACRSSRPCSGCRPTRVIRSRHRPARSERRHRCCGRPRRGSGRWWCSSTTCSGPEGRRSGWSTCC